MVAYFQLLFWYFRVHFLFGTLLQNGHSVDGFQVLKDLDFSKGYEANSLQTFSEKFNLIGSFQDKIASDYFWGIDSYLNENWLWEDNGVL